MAGNINKWTPGASYGPVLSQTDLYLLQTELELNPILQGNSPAFSLTMSLTNGIAGGLNGESSERDLAFIHKDEPATIPRVSQLMIITQHSPWCTIVRNDRGVTMGDVCQQLFNEYTQETITDAEFNSINPRLQENIKRAAHALLHGPYANSYYTAAPPPPATIKRISWLRERHWFESLQKDDSYVISRLGFKAPNIFVLSLAQY